MDDFPGWSNDQAFSEGWGIFEMTGSAEPYQLQFLANPELGAAADTFDNDDDAWAFVKGNAASGSAYHQGALEWIKKHSPIEWGYFNEAEAA